MNMIEKRQYMKKGFTLVELLAVIVILAIIALIAIPQVLNIIDDSKNKSYLISTQNYLRAVEQAIYNKNVDDEFNPKECEIKSDGNLICNKVELKINVSGSKPNEGTIFLKDNEIKKALNFKYEGLEKYITKEIDSDYKIEEYTPIPDLMNDALTPVIYNGTNWEVADKADNWYDYDNWEWANAVILTDSSKNKKEVGTELDLETDVKAMFVWIPRYEYTIGNTYGVKLEGGREPSLDTPGAIDIKFVSSKEEKKNGEAKYTGENPSEWYTHPAFTFDGNELSGFWVGKFETSTDNESICYTNASEANCDNELQEPYILPNRYSLRYQNISNEFKTAQKFNLLIQGNSHMIKNIEWGAIAYLSQSKYGKYGYDREEIYINNCSRYVTGIAGNSESASSTTSTCTTSENKYDGTTGVKASTTGTIYGVYDMNGGAWEQVMGYLEWEAPAWGADKDGYYAGFEEKPDSKYYDLYQLGTNENNVAYKGQALWETNKWYGDLGGFVSSSRPWLLRGGDQTWTVRSGVFRFNNDTGNGYYAHSFRITLLPIKA